MHHDLDLLDRLSAFSPVRYEGDVFRATRRGLDPLATSVAGGRWMVPNEAPTLYTSCERDGALAEISHHWSLLTPVPSKPVVLHKLGLRTVRTLKLGRAELVSLGVDWSTYGHTPSVSTQRIGAAVAFLELDGLIAPSARWNCENIMLFLNNHDVAETILTVKTSEEVDWQKWAKDHPPPSLL
jgi:hypothetical protein